MIRRARLALLAWASVAACVDEPPAPDKGALVSAGCDGAYAVSSVVSGHTHSVCVPARDLATPAAPARYTTSFDAGHEHQLDLSLEQLQQLQRGDQVRVTTSAVGHRHEVALTR